MKQLTEGSILKNLLFFSWPLMLSDLLMSLFSAVDAFWVGRLIGKDALAAISSSMPIMFFLVSLLIGLSVATVILVGQAWGKKDMGLLSEILANSFLTILALVGVMSLTGVLFCGKILKLLGTPGEIFTQAHAFLSIIFGGMIFMFLQNWFSGILRGFGDSKTPLLMTAIQVSLNIILAPLLITGYGILPELKISGAALATVISGFITSLVYVIYLTKKHPMLNIFKWNFRPVPEIIKKMFTLGIPVSLQMVIVSISAVVLISIVNRFGPAVIAAYGIGIRLDQFAFFPAMSIGGSAASAFASQAVGSGRTDRIPEVIKWSLALTFTFAALYFIVILIFSRQISGIFTEDAAVIEHCVTYFKFSIYSYFAYGMFFTYQGIIRGAGDTMPSTIFAFISIIIFRLGIAFGLLETTPLAEKSVWIAMLVSPFTGIALNYWYYRTGKWKGKKISRNIYKEKEFEARTPSSSEL